MKRNPIVACETFFYMYEKHKEQNGKNVKRKRNKKEPVKRSLYVLMHVYTHTHTLYIEIYGFLYPVCIIDRFTSTTSVCVCECV